jgi:SPW repeat-containing protein
MSALTHNYAAQARTASGINILLGVWLLVSPWVFGYKAVGAAAICNSVIVGALIASLAASRCLSPRSRTGLSWVNVLLALWTMISPLVYGYTANRGALVDNMVLGVAIAAFAIWSEDASTAEKNRNQHPPGALAR